MMRCGDIVIARYLVGLLDSDDMYANYPKILGTYGVDSFFLVIGASEFHKRMIRVISPDGKVGWLCTDWMMGLKEQEYGPTPEAR